MRIEDLTGIDNTSELVKSIVDRNVMSFRLPSKNGYWSDDRKIGDSKWIPDDAAEFSWEKDNKKHIMTYGELKKKYGIEFVDYIGKEPDFSSFEDKQIGHIDFDSIPDQRKGRGGTYNLATEAAAKRLGWTKKDVQDYMDEKELTWHECADRKTIRAIPTEINAAFPHTGGISVQNSISAVRDGIYEKYGKVVLKPGGVTGTVKAKEFREAITGMKRIYRGYKKK